MNVWIIYLGLFGVLVSATVSSENKQQSCPELCTCSDNRATCTSLNLSSRFGNDIANLKISSPSGSKKETIVLSDTILNKLGITLLQQLIIENVNITKIDWRAFNDVRISQIIIRNSIVPEIPKLLFKPVTNLNLLEISNSILLNFTEIRSGSVEEINLSGCNISKISNSAFLNSPNLKYLNLAENLLTDFDNNTSNVDQLNLSRNRILKVNFNVLFGGYRTLLDLDLSFNPITEIIGADVDLEKLKLKSCNLSDLKFLTNMTALDNLDLSENKITTLQTNDFSNLKELQTLNLANNNIDFLPPDVFSNNNRLYKLILDNNPLKTLPMFYLKNKITRLSYFSCSGCRLELLSGNTFQYSPSLNTINFSNNKLNRLPVTIFQNVLGLDKIDLSNNQLQDIDPDLFIQNTNLKTVKLSKNPLQNLDPIIFRNNKVLNELDVSNCNLTKLWKTSSKIKLPSITELYVRYNKITVITIDELEITPKLKAFELDGNPLNCDLNLEKLNTWMTDRDVTSLQVKDYINSQGELTINEEKNFGWLKDCHIHTLENDSNEEEIEYDDDKDDDITIGLNEDENDNESDNVQRVNLVDSDEKDDDFSEDIANVLAIEEQRFRPQQDFNQVVSFLLPALVFVLTTLIVLIFAVTLILYVMHKRNRKSNMPQINIIPWANTNKTKIHSGSVYRSLSEEKIPV